MDSIKSYLTPAIEAGHINPIPDHALYVTYSDVFLDWQLGEDHEVNPIRALAFKQKVDYLVETGMCKFQTGWDKTSPARKTILEQQAGRLLPEELAKAQQNPLWDVELFMFAGTHHLTEKLISDTSLRNATGVYFNPAGGENTHHPDVEVFPDLAWACLRLAESGKKVAYIDWDAHPATSFELSVSGAENISVYSVSSHQYAQNVKDSGEFSHFDVTHEMGSEVLVQIIGHILDQIEEAGGVDVLVVNVSTDGLAEDQSSDLEWSLQSYGAAAHLIGEFAGQRAIPILAGGGGGTLPIEDGAPDVWHLVVGMMITEMSRQLIQTAMEEVQARAVDGVEAETFELWEDGQ